MQICTHIIYVFKLVESKLKISALFSHFAKYGPCKTMMAEIAKDCDVSVGNVYRHFENKNTVMIACLEQQLQEKLDAVIKSTSHHRDLLLTYEKKVIAAIAVILQKGVQQGQFSCGDTMQTTYDIHQASLRYNNPISLQNNSLEQLSIDLNHLLDLLYSGLQNR
ncbi:MAG: TetR family transcriptional regulator [Mariprofundaceae bacterium]|nr:TetR family transcriptional regulator [Mariprofundaceae bacterium]